MLETEEKAFIHFWGNLNWYEPVVGNLVNNICTLKKKTCILCQVRFNFRN